jgi:hypothetical protein
VHPTFTWMHKMALLASLSDVLALQTRGQLLDQGLLLERRKKTLAVFTLPEHINKPP